jgi:hypothetical protein
MPDFLSIKADPDDTPRQVTPLPPRVSQRHPNLIPCIDCDHMTSKHAEHCPNCGRFFQRFDTGVKVNHRGWITTIAFGILFAAFIPTLIFIVGLVLLFLLGYSTSQLAR